MFRKGLILGFSQDRVGSLGLLWEKKVRIVQLEFCFCFFSHHCPIIVTAGVIQSSGAGICKKAVPTREIVELWVIKLAKIVILEKNVMTKHPQKPLVIPKSTNEKVICFRHITVTKENPKSGKKEAKAHYFQRRNSKTVYGHRNTTQWHN